MAPTHKDLAYRLWISATSLLALCGLALGIALLLNLPPTPFWSGRVSVIENAGGRVEELDGALAQAKFIAGDVKIASDREITATTPDGTPMSVPAANARRALELGWHFATQSERDQQERRRSEILIIALCCLVAVPLVAFAAFRWGIWLVRGHEVAPTRSSDSTDGN